MANRTSYLRHRCSCRLWNGRRRFRRQPRTLCRWCLTTIAWRKLRLRRRRRIRQSMLRRLRTRAELWSTIRRITSSVRLRLSRKRRPLLLLRWLRHYRYRRLVTVALYSKSGPHTTFVCASLSALTPRTLFLSSQNVLPHSLLHQTKLVSLQDVAITAATVFDFLLTSKVVVI